MLFKTGVKELLLGNLNSHTGQFITTFVTYCIRDPNWPVLTVAFKWILYIFKKKK